MMVRVVGLMALTVLLVGCDKVSSPVPAPATVTPAPSTTKHGGAWAVAGFGRNGDDANVYSVNTENGRVCEYWFSTANLPLGGGSGAMAPQRTVGVTCSSAVDTDDPVDSE